MSTVKKIIALISVTFLVASCGYFSGDQGISDASLKKMHIDANLFFALALPASWTKIGAEKGRGDENSVAWRSEETTGEGQPVKVVRVTSLPAETAKGGFARLKKDFFERRSDLDELSSSPAEINGLPAMRVIARRADGRSLIVFITTYRRAFILEFTALAGEFDQSRPLFEEILQSFQVL